MVCWKLLLVVWVCGLFGHLGTEAQMPRHWLRSLGGDSRMPERFQLIPLLSGRQAKPTDSSTIIGTLSSIQGNKGYADDHDDFEDELEYNDDDDDVNIAPVEQSRSNQVSSKHKRVIIAPRTASGGGIPRAADGDSSRTFKHLLLMKSLIGGNSGGGGGSGYGSGGHGNDGHGSGSYSKPGGAGYYVINLPFNISNFNNNVLTNNAAPPADDGQRRAPIRYFPTGVPQDASTPVYTPTEVYHQRQNNAPVISSGLPQSSSSGSSPQMFQMPASLSVAIPVGGGASMLGINLPDGGGAGGNTNFFPVALPADFSNAISQNWQSEEPTRHHNNPIEAFASNFRGFPFF